MKANSDLSLRASAAVFWSNLRAAQERDVERLAAEGSLRRRTPPPSRVRPAESGVRCRDPRQSLRRRSGTHTTPLLALSSQRSR